MKENIETKDVQRTGYLDKNGLDMLWAKVKENTHNQVEVEYNRAKAKEDSLSQEIASVKPDEGKSYIQAKLTDKEQDVDRCYYDVAGSISFKSEYSDSYGGHITSINKNGIGITFDNDPMFGSTGLLHVKKNDSYNITMQGRGRLLHDTRDTFNEVSIKLLEDADTTYANSNDGNSMLISQLGIFYTSQNYALTSNDLLTGHGGYKTIGTDIAPLENGKVPAEYLDLSQIDTSDFVSKTTTDAQSLKSSLNVSGGLSIGTKSPRISMYASDGAPSISLGPMSGSQYNVNLTTTQLIMSSTMNMVEITCDGISSTDNNANHVFATDGSIADLTQYALSSTLAALEQKVTDNTTAISCKQDAGNYIPYNMLAFKNKYVIEPSYSIEFRTDALNNKYGKAFIGPQIISITSASGQHAAVEPEEISIKQSGNASGRIHSTLNVDSFGVYNNNDDSVIFKLNQYGIKLEDGDDNHVLTSNASTIDITQYALKSVYDKKIAALEARIAALEAKHAETA